MVGGVASSAAHLCAFSALIEPPNGPAVGSPDQRGADQVCAGAHFVVRIHRQSFGHLVWAHHVQSDHPADQRVLILGQALQRLR